MKTKDNIYLKGMFKWGDIVLIVILIIAIVLTVLFALNQSASVVEIYVDKQLVYQANLNENQTIDLLDGRVKVVVKNQQVYISESDCASQTCVKTKPIGKEGGMIVCLPNKVLVKTVKRGAGPNNVTH